MQVTAVLTCVPILVLANAKVVVLDSYAKMNVVAHAARVAQVIAREAVEDFHVELIVTTDVLSHVGQVVIL